MHRHVRGPSDWGQSATNANAAERDQRTAASIRENSRYSRFRLDVIRVLCTASFSYSYSYSTVLRCSPARLLHHREHVGREAVLCLRFPHLGADQSRQKGTKTNRRGRGPFAWRQTEYEDEARNRERASRKRGGARSAHRRFHSRKFALFAVQLPCSPRLVQCLFRTRTRTRTRPCCDGG